MSVVNDVLKNLNQRHAQASASMAIPYVYEQEKSPPYIMMSILAGLILLSFGLSIKLWMDSQSQYLALELDPELFFIEPLAIKNESLPDNTSSIERLVAVKPEPLIKESPVPKLAKYTEPEMQAITVVKARVADATKTESANGITQQSSQSVANMQAVDSMNRGDDIAAQRSSINADKAISDAIALRLMVKNSPQNVYGFIKDNYQDFHKQPDLLAIAAQAQQRIGEHNKAIELYKMLIRVQPQDARWRVGFAISLEGSRDAESALKMYRMALELGNLPQALAQFCHQRIQYLS